MLNNTLFEYEFPEYAIWDASIYQTLHESIYESVVVNEFVNTVPYDVLKRQFIAQLGPRKYNLNKTHSGDKCSVYVFNSNRVTSIDDLLAFMDKMGWYPANIDNKVFNDKELFKQLSQNDEDFSILFEQHKSKELEYTQDKLYHVTPDIRWSNIELSGLNPKTRSKLSYHPSRVYLFTKYDTNMFEKLSKTLYKREPADVASRIKEYYLLEIDISTIKDRMHLFNDPNLKGAVWTTDVIPPRYITIIDKYII